MNQDQFLSLLRTAGKCLGSALAARGIGDDDMWTAVIGAAVAVASWYWSHRTHASPPSPK